jgi:hypothetical protein
VYADFLFLYIQKRELKTGPKRTLEGEFLNGSVLQFSVPKLMYHQYLDFIGKAKLIVVGTSNFYIRFEKYVSEPLTHRSLDLNLKLLWI